MAEKRHIGFRIEPEMLEKLHTVAEYEGRSVNGHVLYLIRESVSRFEKEHGEIELTDKHQQ